MGDEELTANCRELALLDAGYKLMVSIIGRRLREWIEKKVLKESQAGFREGRTTIDHIFVLKSLINNRLKRKGEKLYVAFIDFKKA